MSAHTSSEVVFRFAGNKVLDPGTATMTVGEFYDHYSHPSRAAIYVERVPSDWKPLAAKGKPPLICLEAFILVTQASGIMIVTVL